MSVHGLLIIAQETKVGYCPVR